MAVSYEDGAQKTLDERPLIVSFWHSCIIPATYICRDMGVRVMSSYSYDGEYMGRIIRNFGFVAVKGSSSRNPVRLCSGCAARSEMAGRWLLPLMARADRDTKLSPVRWRLGGRREFLSLCFTPE